MARKGRAGPALMIAAVGSFIGGTVSILGLMFIAPPLAKVMIAIGPSVEVVLMLLALSVITMVSAGSRLKTALMVVLGLLLGSIGLDNLTGTARFTFGYTSLAGGLSFTALAIGLFGVSEILINLEKTETIKAIRPKLRDLVPHWNDLRAAAPAIGRGSIIGFIFGIIPGVSHVVSTFVSYAIEKKFSKHPEEFGKGAIEGVAGPETANNAVTGTAMIPLLALGIPSIPATAILLSALTIHGVQPGPLLLTDHPEVFWSLVASMYIGNAILLILNLPLVGMFVNLLRIPYAWLVPIILIISVIGVYSVNSSSADIWIMVISGAAGYILRKFGYEMAPLLLALVLGDRLESSFRLALTMSGGNYATFADKASVIVLSSALGILLAVQGLAWAFGYRKTMADEAEGA
jgi:putative tricarboxylic transport membrane protein